MSWQLEAFTCTVWIGPGRRRLFELLFQIKPQSLNLFEFQTLYTPWYLMSLDTESLFVFTNG